MMMIIMATMVLIVYTRRHLASLQTEADDIIV